MPPTIILHNLLEMQWDCDCNWKITTKEVHLQDVLYRGGTLLLLPQFHDSLFRDEIHIPGPSLCRWLCLVPHAMTEIKRQKKK